MTFNDFNFEADLLEGLQYMGFNNATPIQEQAIPIIMADRDLIACAQTGTGKTAAYLLPTINKLTKSHGTYVDTLIIVPTRELAIQINESLQGFSYFTPVSSIAIYGGSNGSAFEQEKRALTEGTNIIIATPGRLIAHLNMGYVKMDKLKHLILDEADRMLDMGFSDDLNKIITYLPKNRQTLMFSATMPSKIRTLAKLILNDPAEINIALSKPAEGVTQGAYVLYDGQKLTLLKSILSEKEISSVIIFSSKKERVKNLEKELARAKFNVASIHSDLEQDQRNEVLRNFKNKKLQILVATDVLSRGIDIDSIGLVVNYDVPDDAEDYIHRVGRTARAATTGIALTFINEADQHKFKRIEDLIGADIDKREIPEILGKGPEYKPEEKRSKPSFKRRPQGNRNGNRRRPHSSKPNQPPKK
ncbi:MAG: DEAD/DEAH box helicase [Bacteroidetes bacterium]|nr:DEAD/DEAH box helicase [Bacteroidota bacterium]